MKLQEADDSFPAKIFLLQSRRAGERKEGGEEDPGGLVRGLRCPAHPAAHSIVNLMKSGPQSLSIWPLRRGPVKDNRLAEHRHYITICRCRQAQQRRDTQPQDRERDSGIHLSCT